MRNRRLHRAPRGRSDPDRGPQAPRVSRLRLGRDRPGRRRTATCSSRSGPASWPTSRRRSPTGRRHAAIGLAHTRWATHGRPNDLNAHPHQDCTGDITVIHNGIIENFRELRDGLEAGATSSTSETDTEAIAHLIEDAYQGDIADATRAALRQIEGAYALAVMHRGEPDRLVGARQNVPLDRRPGRRRDVPGQRRRRDPGPHRTRSSSSRKATWPTCGPSGGHDHRRRRATRSTGAVTTITWTAEAAEKGGYDHFMLKEIHEQPAALRQSIAGRVTRANRIVVEELAGLARAPGRRPPDRAGRLRDRLLRRPDRGGRPPGVDRPAGPGDGRLGVPLRPAAARSRDAGDRRDPVRARPPTRSPRPASPASGAAR